MTVREFYEHCKKIGAEDLPTTSLILRMNNYD